jgi:hypothetical protein
MITLRDGGSAGFVTVTGQILMAAHSPFAGAQRAADLYGQRRLGAGLTVAPDWEICAVACHRPGFPSWLAAGIVVQDTVQPGVKRGYR